MPLLSCHDSFHSVSYYFSCLASKLEYHFSFHTIFYYSYSDACVYLYYSSFSLFLFYILYYRPLNPDCRSAWEKHHRFTTFLYLAFGFIIYRSTFQTFFLRIYVHIWIVNIACPKRQEANHRADAKVIYLLQIITNNAYQNQRNIWSALKFFTMKTIYGDGGFIFFYKRSIFYRLAAQLFQSVTSYCWYSVDVVVIRTLDISRNIELMPVFIHWITAQTLSECWTTS